MPTFAASGRVEADRSPAGASVARVRLQPGEVKQRSPELSNRLTPSESAPKRAFRAIAESGQIMTRCVRCRGSRRSRATEPAHRRHTAAGAPRRQPQPASQPRHPARCSEPQRRASAAAAGSRRRARTPSRPSRGSAALRRPRSCPAGREAVSRAAPAAAAWKHDDCRSHRQAIRSAANTPHGFWASAQVSTGERVGSLTIATLPSCSVAEARHGAEADLDRVGEQVGDRGAAARHGQRRERNRQVAPATESAQPWGASPPGDRVVERVSELVHVGDLAHGVASICIRLFRRARPRCTRRRAAPSVQSSRAAISS